MSATQVYLTNLGMKLFYDRRRLTDLLTDDGTGDDLTDTDIETIDPDDEDLPGTRLYTAILWASSEIDAKCQNGRRYARADLEAMVQYAIDAPVGSTAVQIEGYRKRAATLQKLTADLAFGFLAQRRAQSADKLRQLAPAYEEALVRLEELYEGRKVFDLDSTLDATVPTRRKLGKLAFLQSSFNEMFGLFSTENGMFNRNR
jgi:hypothetical protein